MDRSVLLVSIVLSAFCVPCSAAVVHYELAEGSKLRHKRGAENPEIVAEVPLVGSCVFSYLQRPFGYLAGVGEIEFDSSEGPSYSVRGRGEFVASAHTETPLLNGLPLGGVFLSLGVTINEFRVQLDTGESVSMSSFPAFRIQVFHPFFSPLPEDQFHLFLFLKLVPEDALLFFRRADANSDGYRNVADAVFVVNALFTGGPQPTCLDAADSNDDGEVDVSDAVYLLHWLFVGGDPPPTPTYLCGFDDTEDELDCQGQEGCPNEITLP